MTSRDAAIRLTDVGKRFTKHDDVPTLVGRAMQLYRRTKKSQLWAIRHVDLELERGQTLGVVGKNGSGKTTLLTMLAGVTAPTEGRVEVNGRVAPLIAVGVGFHPELTGRENVYVNGTILGLTTAEIDRRFDEITDFADIPGFIDTPVKFYSSGMYVRLGFAVAISAAPDVLLVDEVLAVGDFAFQLKCFDRMRELQERGTTIVAVTHNLNVVRTLCNQVLVVHEGDPRFLGDTAEGLSLYHELLAQGTDGDKRVATDQAEILRFDLLAEDGSTTAHYSSDQLMLVELVLQAHSEIRDAAIRLTFTSASGVVVYADSSAGDGRGVIDIDPGKAVRCRMRLPASFATGSYTVQAVCLWGPPTPDCPRIMSPQRFFYVAGRGSVTGFADLGASFEMEMATPASPPISTDQT